MNSLLMKSRSFASAADAGGISTWFVAAGCVALTAIALGMLFPHEVLGAVDVWVGSTAYNHCFLIVPLAGYMIWDRRSSLRHIQPRPDPRFLVLLVPLVAAWLVAAGVDVLEIRQFAIIAMFNLCAVTILGWNAYRSLLAPMLYLFFLVPSGQVLVPKLQDITADFAVFGLRALAVPVFADGTVIEIPAGTFVIAEACAGLRFLVASFAFGVFFSIVVYRSRIRRICFVCLSLIVPVLANGLRALGIIYSAHLFGSANAVIADHIIYGWVFFSAVMVILIFVGITFADGSDKEFRKTAVTAQQRRYRILTFVYVAVAAIAIAGVGPAYAAVIDRNLSTISFRGVELPAVAGSWRQVSGKHSVWHPVIVNPGKEFIETYTDGANTVTLYLALYSARSGRNDLIRDQNRIANEDHWRRTSAHPMLLNIDGKSVSIQVTHITGLAQRLAVWHFYIVNKSIVADPLVAKLYQMRDFLAGNGGLSAFVAIAVNVEDDSVDTAPVVKSFLAAMEPIQLYLGDLEGK